MSLRILTICVVFLALPGCGQSRLSKAEELIAVGSLKEASELVTEEIKANPRSGEAFLIKGKIAEAQKDVEGAFQAFESAIKADPSHTRIVARYLLHRINEEEALDNEKYFTKAFQLDQGLFAEKEGVEGRWFVYRGGLTGGHLFFDDTGYVYRGNPRTGTWTNDLTGTWTVKKDILELYDNNGRLEDRYRWRLEENGTKMVLSASHENEDFGMIIVRAWARNN